MAEGSGVGGPGSAPEPKPAATVESAGGRIRFTVELQPGATTIVSWRDLMKEANSVLASGSVASQTTPPHPPVEPHSSRGPAENEMRDSQVENEMRDSQVQPGSNRLNAVIGKIEQLYAGNESGDEVALGNLRDDDEYDTADSFIDDTELDDYFQVDKSVIKHDGFFVNRGKLECIEPTLPTNQQLKKRKLYDLTESGGDGDNISNEIVKIGTKGRNVSSSIQMNSTTESHGVVMPDICDADMILQASSANAPKVSLKNNTTDSQILADPSGLFLGDTISQGLYTDQHRPGVSSSRNWRGSELQDPLIQRSDDKFSQEKESHFERQLDYGLDQLIQQKGEGDFVVSARESLPTLKPPVMQAESSNVQPQSTALEELVKDLEKSVAEPASLPWGNTEKSNPSPNEQCRPLDSACDFKETQNHG